MDDTRSIASSIVSEMRISSRIKDVCTSSLNNLLPEDELSTVEPGMSGICIQTEHVGPPPTNGHYKRTSCESSCSQGVSESEHDNLQSNNLQVFSQTSTFGKSYSVKAVPDVTVTPSTPEQLSKHCKDMADSYEISL